uniref:(northern house mosquito) hypothetical protein n=1 Tax=Culex pipiens TaxID=7175 RepID=A0A8D8KUK8_CULPI
MGRRRRARSPLTSRFVFFLSFRFKSRLNVPYVSVCMYVLVYGSDGSHARTLSQRHFQPPGTIGSVHNTKRQFGTAPIGESSARRVCKCGCARAERQRSNLRAITR